MRSTVAIPAWTENGVLPPIAVHDRTSASRSPYLVSLTDFILRFATSSERCKILRGYLRYRAGLHGAGLKLGFQWVDGSFLENVEITESRPPNDVDVVTFYHLPSGETQETLSRSKPEIFDRKKCKESFDIDAYTTCLDKRTELVIERSTYWYSMWSHRRNDLWKGYLQIDLAPDVDANAGEILNTLPS